ncbi:MAG: mechanosensitive ion channel family protein [Peptococcaceae bacterium]|nr:mechanosensitive ion channel family protein [Peptococcaceae bacterium]
MLQAIAARWEALTQNGAIMGRHLLIIILVLVTGWLAIRFCGILVDNAGKPKPGQAGGQEDMMRRNTVTGMLKNLLRYTIYFVMAVTVLDQFGVPVLAVLSAAGVMGVGIAFGAQTLFRDMITGFFILLENQYYVGEYIEAQGVAGYVEEFTLRCTHLRDFDGRLHILPNGGMTLVTNHHRGGSRVQVDLSVAYESDTEQVLRVLRQVCDEVGATYEATLREKPAPMGITELGDSGVGFRLAGKAEPLAHWEIERSLRKKAKEALTAAGIEIPYPHRQVILSATAANDNLSAAGAKENLSAAAAKENLTAAEPNENLSAAAAAEKP